MLAALTEAYVNAINHGAVPTIATAWQVLAASMNPYIIPDICKAFVCGEILFWVRYTAEWYL